MKPFVVIAALALSIAPLAAQTETTERIERGNLVMEQIPEIPESVSARIAQYQNTRPAAFADWAPDGGMLITTRFAETTQVHLVSDPLGMRQQLTYHQEPVSTVHTRPGRNQIIFQKDIGGNEQYQIYLYDLTSGEETLLTDPDIRNDDIVISPDGNTDRRAHV